MTNACGQQNYDAERAALVDELRHESRLAEDYGAPPLSDTVLASIGTVPRHEFVPPAERRYSYANHPLPIGAGQTMPLSSWCCSTAAAGVRDTPMP